MTDFDNYTEHIDLAAAIFSRAGLGKLDPEKLSPPVLHNFLPQVVVVQVYDGGPAEVDTVSIVGFYIPHDGQCTVAVNHMDGVAVLDNASLMFPPSNHDEPIPHDD